MNRFAAIGVLAVVSALTMPVTAQQKAVFNSWGKGMYDPRFNLDGQNKPVVIAPAFGLLGVHKVTFTGDGNEIAYWNRYVGVTQMGGHGSFSDPRLGINIVQTPDKVVHKLPHLREYQFSLLTPLTGRS